jgi:uncharacterized membrane protein YkvI
VSTHAGESTWFQRYVLPGFALKALIIGGGYATGRELVEFFLPSGAWGGLLGLGLAAAAWSAVAALTFLYARRTGSLDYRSLFRALLGPAWPVFELTFLVFLVVLLAVYGATAGALGNALLGAPRLAGTLLLIGLIAGAVAFGNESVERLFKYVSWLLYAVYAVFLGASLSAFGPDIRTAFAVAPPGDGWIQGGVTYAAYNIVGVVLVLSVLRHVRSDRNAVAAGLLAGPLAMLPAILFFICMAAWPQVRDAALPSDLLLEQLGHPLLRWTYPLMIFAALLESGAGGVHAFNERVAAALPAGRALRAGGRLGISLVVLAGAVFLADRFGLVQLIATGYRYLAYAVLAVYIVPLLTVGAWQLLTGRARVTPSVVRA